MLKKNSSNPDMINSTCQEWTFLSGFITYPVSSRDNLFEDNLVPFFNIMQKFQGNYTLFNEQAYRASLHRDSDNKINGEYHPEDFDFCYDNLTKTNCVIISFSNYNNFQKINNYGRKVDNASCIDTFSVDESAW